MKKERIKSPNVSEPPPELWSNCVRVGNTIYMAGLTARARDGVTVLGDNEYEQAKTTFQKFKDYITAAGGQMNDFVKLTIYVTNIKKNTEVWRARKEFFSGDFPACTLVEVSALATPELLLEIEGVAILNCAP